MILAPSKVLLDLFVVRTNEIIHNHVVLPFNIDDLKRVLLKGKELSGSVKIIVVYVVFLCICKITKNWWETIRLAQLFMLKVGSKNSVFSSLPNNNHSISVAFCLIWSLFATFLGYIARYAPSKTDKNPIKSIQKSIRHNL